jgi:hypothetical protein
MFPINVKASEQIGVLDAISPVSQAPGAVTTAWVSAQNFNKLLAIVQVGAFGASATVDANVQQATDSAGTGAKAFTNAKVITQMLAASGNNKQVEINIDSQELDVENSFYFVRLTVTVGTAASLVSAALLGFNPRNAPGSDNNNASVTQIVG